MREREREMEREREREGQGEREREREMERERERERGRGREGGETERKAYNEHDMLPVGPIEEEELIDAVVGDLISGGGAV